MIKIFNFVSIPLRLLFLVFGTVSSIIIFVERSHAVIMYLRQVVITLKIYIISAFTGQIQTI